MDKWQLGVFASADAGLGVRLEVVRQLGVHTIHLLAPQAESRAPDQARELARRLSDLDITVTCIFGRFAGESYADIPIVKRTVGLVPAATRSERLREMMEIADFARLLDVEAVGLHIGCLPRRRDDPAYTDTVAAADAICGHCAASGQILHLETGQEPADVLLRFIEDVGRKNLYVNFDPANMILYGVGEPLPALVQLGRFVRGVHCKDATWSDWPGVTWGREVNLGEGDVGFPTFLQTLDGIGYLGPLTIEREIPSNPERQRTELARAVERLKNLVKQVGT